MHVMLRTLCGVVVLGATSLVTAQPAPRIIEEIVVTAQKREQGAQDVPIALSVFDARFLEDAGIDDVFELQVFTPGLTVYNTQTAAQTNFNIRGVGTAGNSLSLEPSVGVYIDGVYRSRQSSAIGDLVDLARVEVLKGPQGTLFGRNTAAGAIQFVTEAPDLEVSEGFLEVTGGNLDARDLSGALSIPLREGRLAARVSGSYSERDGYVDNLATGSSLQDRDRWSLRGQLLFAPTDALELRLIADASRIDERCCATANVLDGPADDTAAFLAAGGVPGFGIPGASFRLPIDLLGGAVARADQLDDEETLVDIDPFARVEESGVSAQVDWQLGDATLTSITALRDYEVFARIDADFTSLELIGESGSTTDQRTFTQELRLAGTLFEERTHYVAGLYYFDQQLDDDQVLRFGTGANGLLAAGATLGQLLGGAPACAALGVTAICDGPAFPANEGGDNLSRQDQRSVALFAQVDHDLAEDLLLTLGVRYLDEEKEMDVRFTETLFTPAFTFFTVVSPTVPDVQGARFEDQALTGTAKMSWFLTPDVMAWVSWGRGYKSGGTNIDRIDPGLTGAPLLFDPETSDAWEIGFKGDFLDRRLRVNGALHRTDFDDFQANTFVGTGFVLQNAGQLRTQGFELEVSALPVHWLALSAGVAWVDAEYERFRAGACISTPLGASPDAADPGFPATCDNSGNPIAGTPEWTLHGSVQVERRIGDAGYGYGQLDVAWQDENPGGNDGDANKIADAYTLTNLRIGYRFSEDRYDVSLWAKNLLDEDYTYLAFNSPAREGSLSGYLTEPRTWGATLRARF